MNSRRYRIRTLTVANFRGITEQQTIDVQGRHLFLPGPNGYGKSTVVEAIRWRLPWPEGQQQIEVRNTFYPAKTAEVVVEPRGVGR